MRRATLSLDSDLEPHPDLFIRAAQGAAWYSDMPLAERLADAAVRAGGGAEASFARAYALMCSTVASRPTWCSPTSPAPP